MKKLAIITTHPIQYNAPLFKLLNERGKIQIKVFYTWGEEVLKDKFDPGFGKTIQWDIPLLKGYDYEFLENIAVDKGSHHFKGIDNPHIIEKIEKFTPDAVLVYGWSFKSHLKVLQYFKNKIPVLFRGDSTLLDESSFLSSLKRNLFLRWVYRYVDIALYVGKNNFDYFRKAGLKKNQLIFAPHAIENERFQADPEEGNNVDRFRLNLDIGKNDLIFLFAGKIESKKAPELLLESFSLCSFDKQVHLVIVGNGVLEQKLKVDYQHQKNIHFLDFQNQTQMPAVYEMSDVFVLPSKGPGETWGLSVNEAMAAGKAILVSDKCGCAVDLVKNGENGFVFKSGDKKDLILKLKMLAKDKEKLKQMGIVSREIIQSSNYSKVCQAIEKVIEKNE